MPFENINLNSSFFRNDYERNFDRITINLDDKANSQYLPYGVNKIYDINVDDFSSVVSAGQYFVLTSQITASENGLYLQDTPTTVTKQANPSKNTFYLDVTTEGKRAVFLDRTREFFPVNFNRVILGTSINTSVDSSNTIFDFPLPYSKPVFIKTVINGIDSNDRLFTGHYENTYYNKEGTTILQLNNPGSITLRSDNTNFSLPTVTYTAGGSLTLQPNSANSIDWYIKSEFLF